MGVWLYYFSRFLNNNYTLVWISCQEFFSKFTGKIYSFSYYEKIEKNRKNFLTKCRDSGIIGAGSHFGASRHLGTLAQLRT